MSTVGFKTTSGGTSGPSVVAYLVVVRFAGDVIPRTEFRVPRGEFSNWIQGYKSTGILTVPANPADTELNLDGGFRYVHATRVDYVDVSPVFQD